jgi:O-glycosyl hydrolase
MMKPHRTIQQRFLRLTIFAALANILAALSLPARAAEPIRGMVGVGTWSTQAEFKDIKVVKGNQTLYSSDFSKGLEGWKTMRGKWEVVDGVLRQSSNEQDARALIGDPAWSDYTLMLKARKLGGEEGFLIFFGLPNAGATSRWNIGGWGNTKHALQAPDVSNEQLAGKIETGRWYDIRIELKGNSIRAFLDNQLVQEATQAPADERITIDPERPRQVFQGMGAGAIFYEGHITSLAANDKEQQHLYDDMFDRVPTRYLQLMMRETHESQNDDADPWTPAFDDKNFDYARNTLQIAKAALKRRPDTQLYAVLYTPPAWMKTNNDASGGGKARATLKDGLELELAEYIWAFLSYMERNSAPIQYVSIANEPDWTHDQPSYFLSSERFTALFKTVGGYLDKMAIRFPKVPRPKLVGPNTLSAPSAVADYVPRLLKECPEYLDVVASHDYDQRGDRWSALQKLAGNRPLWMTEWCAQGKDESPAMINSAVRYGMAMSAGFNGGVNVWMAYDWVYPPRDSGEALIHVNWGQDYRLLKPYYVFRQWCRPLTPGMLVVQSSGAKNVKVTAFVSSDKHTLVVHIANGQDRDAPLSLELSGNWAAAMSAARTRTSAGEDDASLPKLGKVGGSFADVLPAQSMTTYLFAAA